MTKSELVIEIEKLSSNLPKKQKDLVSRIVELFEPYENHFENGTLYAKKVKDKESSPPLNLLTIGVKERPLSFVRFSLNLDTNEVTKVASSLKEIAIELEPITDPIGVVTTYKPYHTHRTVQSIEII